MADFSVSLTVPDDKVAALLDAINWHVDRRDASGNADPMTGAEAKAWLKQSVENSVRDIYKRHKEYLRSQQSVDTDISLT